MDSTRRYERWDPGSIPGGGSTYSSLSSGNELFLWPKNLKVNIAWAHTFISIILHFHISHIN